MKIIDIKVTERRIPLKIPFKTALRTAYEIESVEVNVLIENGVVGKGAASPTLVITGESAESMKAILTGPIKQNLVGKDIYQFCSILQAIQSCCIGNTSAKAAADIAIHDAYSKLINLPLHTFLGDQKPLHTSMTVSVDTPERMAADALTCVEDGFKKLKIKVGAFPELDRERLEAIHETIGNRAILRLDANQGWSPKQAVQLINELEEMNFAIEFIEQPVKADDLVGLKFVTDNVVTPIMADESLFSPKDALRLVTGRYTDLLNIKLMKCGGITNAWKIASIAETEGVACMIGSMMEPGLSVSAAAHFAAAHPNVHYFDLDAPLWLSETSEHIHFEEENVHLSNEAGIGTLVR